MSVLGLAEHLSSFPEHLQFLTHLAQDLDVIDAFAERAKTEKDGVTLSGVSMAPTVLAHNPSTCYHCYAARRDTEIESEIAVTAITKCHRFEASNHLEFGRLLEFSMREVIFIGSPGFVRQSQTATLGLIKEWASEWQLFGDLTASNDPFFTNEFVVKAAHQRRMAMKFEYRMTIPGNGGGLSVLSSNLHGVTLAKAFALKRRGGPVHTGCLAFGLERLALGIAAQHGIEPAAWPAPLARQFEAWNRDRGGR